MTFPNPKWEADISTVLDNAAAVDKGGGLVGLPVTAHSFLPGQIITLAGTINYDGDYEIISETADEVVITAAYVAETFTGAETIVFGGQVILKSDLKAIETAVATQGTVRMQPPLVWVDADTVKLEATDDCVAAMQFTGMPSILNPSVQVSGGLSDGKIRTISSPITLIMSSGGMYGDAQTEQHSQWYAVFAVAGDTDTDFELKAIPFMRVKSQSTKTLYTGTLADPNTAIDYEFTPDDPLIVGGKVYFLSGVDRGPSLGLMREIVNVGADASSTTITYTGDTLTVAQDDWFIILPPTNFRLVGTIFNNSSSNIRNFHRLGNWVVNLAVVAITGAAFDTEVEDITIACPLATKVRTTHNTISAMGHHLATLSGAAAPDIGHGGAAGATPDAASATYINSTVEWNLEFCRYKLYPSGAHHWSEGYAYPPGCGY